MSTFKPPITKESRALQQHELDTYPPGFPVSEWEERSWTWATASLGSKRAAAIWMWKRQQARIEELEAQCRGEAI